MKALITAIAILLSATIVAAASSLKLRSGASLDAEVVEKRNGESLLHTRSDEGDGLAWISASMVSDGKPVDISAELERADKLILAGRADEARLLLEPLAREFPKDLRAKRLLALACRLTWRFSTAYFLLEDVVRRGEAESGEISPDDARALAEVGVLLGNDRKGRDAIRYIRRATYPNRDSEKAAREYGDALREQLDGGEKVTFRDVTPEKYQRERLRDERMEYEAHESKLAGSNLHCSKLAAATLGFLLSEGDRTPRKSDTFATRVYIRSIAPKAAEEAYLSGRLLKNYTNAVSNVEVFVWVNYTEWLRMWDWQKHAEVYGVLFRAARSFPNADVAVSFGGRPPGAADNTFLATAKKTPEGVGKSELKTRQLLDRERLRDLIDEQEDYEEDRNR